MWFIYQLIIKYAAFFLMLITLNIANCIGNKIRNLAGKITQFLGKYPEGRVPDAGFEALRW